MGQPRELTSSFKLTSWWQTTSWTSPLREEGSHVGTKWYVDQVLESIRAHDQPGVGTIAINDAFMLEAAIYFLLKKYFRQEPYYVDLFELFQETTFQTEMGQLIDLLTAPEDHVDLSKFSLEK